MICLPSHSTHLLQPLDVGCFGLYTKNYNAALDSFHLKNGLWAEVKKPQFWELLKGARKATFTSEMIVAAWKKSGCWPIASEPPTGCPLPKRVDLTYARLDTPAK